MLFDVMLHALASCAIITLNAIVGKRYQKSFIFLLKSGWILTRAWCRQISAGGIRPRQGYRGRRGLLRQPA